MKFRIYDKMNKIFIYDDDASGIKFLTDSKGNIFKFDHHLEMLDSNQYLISYHTGFFDECGKAIFNGDIVKDIIDEEIGYIGNRYGEYRAIIDNVSIRLDPDCADYLEVIGNIYENKEFLSIKEE